MAKLKDDDNIFTNIIHELNNEGANRACPINTAIDSAGIKHITLTTIDKKLTDMKRRYEFWLYFFLFINVCNLILIYLHRI